MPCKSPFPYILRRFALIGSFLVAFYAANATAQYLPFVNVSARSQVLTGQNVVTVGFIITGTVSATKRVIIRGLGPSTGLPGYLADPTLTLNGPSGVISNNNWKDTQQNEIAATGFQPGYDSESAILVNLAPGSYTVTFAGNNGGTGVGVIDAYDLGGPSPVVNVSSRAWVGTGNDVLIGGLYVRDATRAIARAIGPTFGLYGIQGALQDPSLDIYNSSGTRVGGNDNWAGDGNASEIQQLGFAPTYGSESATITSLSAGSYTAIVSGAGGTSGVGQVEWYSLEDAPYPRIFQNWFNVTNLPNETDAQTVARHDLFWTTLNGFGLYWTDGNGNVTQDYTSETLAYSAPSQAYDIAALRSLNPRIKILGQIQHYSATLNGEDRLDINSPWWRKVNGQLVAAPGEPGRYLLDQENLGLRAHVAAQAKALMDRGDIDGIMLDRCAPVFSPVSVPYPLNLITDVRNRIGDNAIIIVNVNTTHLTAAQLSPINGLFMECGYIGTGTGGQPSWQTVKSELDNNEANIWRRPKVNCLQDWYSTGPENGTDLQRMRALTALGLTHSDGYVNFGAGSDYHWYDPFWSDHSLGRPMGSKYTISGNAERRDFLNGSAVYNQVGNVAITVTFPEQRRNRFNNTWGTSFYLPPGDGGIYTKN